MQKPPYCSPCALAPLSNGFSRPDGRGSIGVCFIGEALGREEYIDGLPFRPKAEAGSTLKLAIEKLGYQRDQFLFWNLVACQPPNNHLAGAWYESQAIAHCRHHFEAVMSNWQPPTENRVLVACGNLAMRELTGMSGEAGCNESIKYTRGYVFKSKWGYVIPAYHPSYIRRGNMQQLDSLIQDIKKAVELAMGDYKQHRFDVDYRGPDYNTHASLDDLVGFYNKVQDNERLPLAIDIETSTTSGLISEDEWHDFAEDLAREEIELIQFSLGRNTGLAVPFCQPYFELIGDILATRNQKAGHNIYGFDQPKLDAAGFRIKGIIHDTMNMFKIWHPRLDRHLQGASSCVNFPFPWKHMFSSKKSWYGCADVDSVQWLLGDLPRMLKAIKSSNGTTAWDCYRDHLLRIRPILGRAEKVGIPVDGGRRVALEAKLRTIRDRLVGEIQVQVPEEIKGLHPRRKVEGREGEFSYGYKAIEPKIVKDAKREYVELVRMMKDRATNGDERYKGKKPKSFKVWVKRKYGLEIQELLEWDVLNREYVKVKRWVMIKAFLPTSPDQVKRYMTWKQGEIEREIRELENK